MRLIAIGDLSLNGRYDALLTGAKPNPMRAVRDWNATDLVVGNLESPITTAARVAPSKCTLRGSENARTLFESHHFRVVSLANNHMMDFGPGGLVDTRRYLDECGVKHCGGGANLAQATAPLIIEHLNQRVGFLSYCDVEQKSPLYADGNQPGVAPWQGESSLESIRRLRNDVEWLIVMFHWGVEMSRLPTVGQRELARQIVSAGADVILGSHPHVMQPIEEIDGKTVAYSLGNFLFSPMYWRGVNASGENFCSKLRLHPLSRRTGWLQMDLEPSRPLRWALHPARLTQSLAISPGWPSNWHRDWEQLHQMLDSADYEDLSLEETELGRQRTRQRWDGRPILRRIEMKLYQFGAIPGASDTL